MGSDGEPSRAGLYGLILLMVLIWSANYVVGKIALREIPPMLLIALRMLVSGITMIPIYLYHRSRTGVAGFTRADVPLLLMLGVFGVGLNQFFFVNGLAKTSVGHAAIMIGLTPMLVLLLASIIGQEKLNAGRLVGMAVALSGVAVLQFSKSGGPHATLRGDVLVFLGGLTFAIFTVAGKATMGRVGGIVVNTFAYVGTGIALLPVTILDGRQFAFDQLSITAWSALLYMSFCPSVLAYLIFYYALARIPASRLSAFSYLQPLFATLMAIPVLGEYPSSSLLAGGCLVLAGVFVAERV